MKLTVGSLFAGVGGIELGLEWTGGFETVWQVESDRYATQILERHWPHVRRWGDVRTFPPQPISEWRCDVLTAGFPCQPVSDAGHKKVRGDKRWLWDEVPRIFRALRPRWILLENVTGLLSRGFDAVLADLAASGFDAEWDCIPAAAFGTPHRRYRVFILAYPPSNGRKGPKIFTHPIEQSLPEAIAAWERGQRLEQRPCGRIRSVPTTGRFGMDDGPSRELDRLRCLGNAVVPQVSQFIGERILAVHRTGKGQPP